MQCMNEVLALFKGQTQCAATVLAAGAAVIGAIVAVALCKLFCRCGKKNGGCGCHGKGRPSRRPEPKFEKRHPAPADGSVELYVGNLSYDMTEDQLRKEFEKYGRVNAVRVVTNRYNNRSKGFGFVQMPNRAEAEAAIKALDEKEILGRRLKCNEAKNVG